MALPVPGEIQAGLDALQRELKSALPSGLVRWTPPAQIHLTLRFLGNIASDSVPNLETAVRRACAGLAPIELRVEGIGAFPDAARPRVLWVGLGGDGEQLGRLHDRVARETEAWGEREEQDFHPHLTLGRVQPARPAEWRAVSQALARVESGNLGPWRAAHVELMQSRLSPAGATHACLVRVPLG